MKFVMVKGPLTVKFVTVYDVLDRNGRLLAVYGDYKSIVQFMGKFCVSSRVHAYEP
jgi:hypothetical protein